MQSFLSHIKSPKAIKLLLMGLLGILFLILSIPGGIFQKNTLPAGSEQKTVEKSGDETQFEQMLLKVEGIDKVCVMLRRDEQNHAAGIVVVVAGREDISVKEEIIRAAEVLFDLPIHKIKIMKMKK